MFYAAAAVPWTYPTPTPTPQKAAHQYIILSPHSFRGIAPFPHLQTMTRFMIQSDDPHLFSPKLISRHVQAQLSDGYTLRPLRRDDFSKGEIFFSPGL